MNKTGVLSFQRSLCFQWQSCYIRFSAIPFCVAFNNGQESKQSLTGYIKRGRRRAPVLMEDARKATYKIIFFKFCCA